MSHFKYTIHPGVDLGMPPLVPTPADLEVLRQNTYRFRNAGSGGGNGLANAAPTRQFTPVERIQARLGSADLDSERFEFRDAIFRDGKAFVFALAKGENGWEGIVLEDHVNLFPSDKLMLAIVTLRG